MSQDFFGMNSDVMILVKIGVIRRNLFGGTPRASECFLWDKEDKQSVSSTYVQYDTPTSYLLY